MQMGQVGPDRVICAVESPKTGLPVSVSLGPGLFPLPYTFLTKSGQRHIFQLQIAVTKMGLND